jgi:hypothetical protein
MYTGSFHNGLQVFEHPFGLLANVRAYKLTGFWIKSNLAGYKKPLDLMACE